MTLLTRRGLITGAAGLAASKRKRKPVGMKPDQEGVFFQLVIQGGGTFTYDASGNLRSAEVGQTIADPIQGITCYAGFSTFNGHGAVISLLSSTLDAQLWYADNGTSTQGALKDSVCPTAGGTDPFGNAFQQGVCSYGPSGITQISNTVISLGLASDSTVRALIQAADTALGYLFMQSARETDLDVPATLTLLSKAAGSGGTQAQGVLAAGAGPGAPSTTALLEVQGSLDVSGTGHFGGVMSQGAGSNSSGSAPSPGQSLVINAAAAQLSDLTRDFMLYLTFSGAGNVTVQAGPTSAAARTIYPTAALVAGAPYPVRIPAGWFIKCTGTGTVAIASQTVVGC